jgi:3',5'-cyclic-AMP phosphodiesterase
VQISDSHIGFHLPPNPDPHGTLTEAIDKIKVMPTQPAFLVHTGDISHLSKEEEWDDADQIIKSANTRRRLCGCLHRALPGEGSYAPRRPPSP